MWRGDGHVLTVAASALWALAAAQKESLGEERRFGRSAPKGRSGPTKYHRLAFRNSLHRIDIRHSL